MTLETIAAKVGAGERLTGSEGKDLLSTSDIISLGMLAEDVRRHRHGDQVTFLRVAHVTVDSAVGADPFPHSAGEVRLDGRPESIEQAAAVLQAVVARAGGVPVSAFSLADLDDLARGANMSLEVCLSQLREAGLERVAQAALDSSMRFDEALEAAARAGVGVSQAVFEHEGEDWLQKIRQLVSSQDVTRSIRALAPLARRPSPNMPTTGYEDLKKVALARLFADNIETIQVDWSLYGPKLAQVALTFGADDLDNVPAADDLSLGPRRTPLEEVRRNIQAAALVPVQRNGRWEVVA
jgi:aminodeoxyfutalosine synthase